MAKAVQEQTSLFDKVNEYKGGFVVSPCTHDKTRNNYCKNWDGKGYDTDAVNDRKCPANITEENHIECKFYVIGMLIKAAKKSKKQ